MTQELRINLEWKKIKRLEFKRYKIVQKSGVTNMLSSDVWVYANIDKETHSAIIQNYEELDKKYSSLEITSQDMEGFSLWYEIVQRAKAEKEISRIKRG